MAPDNISHNSDKSFSFRMFDLYRRFVEIIRTDEKFLKAFKNGVPSEEICQAIIAKTFQHRQPYEQILNMVKYLRKNAQILSAHAENLPDTWDTAVQYTNWCISEIKRYLKNRNINFKTDFKSMPDISKEIGKCLYKNGGNPDQIKIIEEYLREDLRNPKRSIICTKKSKKYNHKEKIFNPFSEKEKSVVIIENEESDSVVSVDVQDESNEGVEMISPINVYYENSGSQGFLKEDLMRTEFTAEIEDLLQPQGHPSTNDLLHIESPEESDEFVLQKNDLNQSKKKDKTDICDVEDIQSILESSKGESEESEDYQLIVEVHEEVETSVNSTENSNNTPSNYYVNANKRKILSSNEPHSSIKKLFISNEVLNGEKAQHITVNSDNNFKGNTSESIESATVRTNGHLRDNACNSAPKTTETEIIQIDDNHYLISEINVDNCVINKKQDTNNNQTKIKNEILDAIEIKTEPETGNEPCNCSTELKNKSPYIQESVKYSDIMDMTYKEALKMMEKILAFCELKNEVSLEEFLVLRRTKDKMHWRSLKEKSVIK